MSKPAKVWESLRLTVNPDAVEAIEFALNSLESLGTEIDYMNQPVAGVCMVGYFDRLPDDETLQDELHYALRAYALDENAILAVERTEIENADWLAEWKKHWKPTTVGRFVIAPPWETVDESDEIVIRIEPSMAFGTGTHETTRLCLAAIDKYYEPGNSFLDVGTGTGILAIAAAKLQARNPMGHAAVVAFDNDPDAIKIAGENAELNSVDDIVQIFEGEISRESPTTDFVCANLTHELILSILPLLFERSKKYLVLSGILAEQETRIVQALTEFAFKSFESSRAGEWICVVVRK